MSSNKELITASTKEELEAIVREKMGEGILPIGKPSIKDGLFTQKVEPIIGATVVLREEEE